MDIRGMQAPDQVVSIVLRIAMPDVGPCNQQTTHRKELIGVEVDSADCQM
jgi:hypothetical protein